jgi:hypothetical protein
MKTTAEKIAVMQAYERREKIEVLVGGTQWLEWNRFDGEPCWAWDKGDYRIAPKPPIEGWCAVWKDNGQVSLTSSIYRDKIIPDGLVSSSEERCCRIAFMREVV